METFEIVHVVCSNCSREIRLNTGSSGTFTCQKCGGVEGEVFVDDHDLKSGGVVGFSCSKCKKDFTLPRLKRTYLACPDCGGRVIKAIQETLFSKVTIGRPEAYAPIENGLGGAKRIVQIPLDGVKFKIVIPYFSGNALVDRAARTWVHPEVVFALTDRGVIPPGWGVCHQFFTPKNAKSEGLSGRSKPFLIDLLERLLGMFPDEDYYGFFNSDTILPPGVPIATLLPSVGREAVFHHRLDLQGDKEKIEHLSKLEKRNQVCVGKDGFVAAKSVVESIIKGMTDLVIGAPTWDDGLLLWCWKKFGLSQVELRYGDIWHVHHPLEWAFEERDSIYNQTQLTSAGIDNNLRFSMNWPAIYNKLGSSRVATKTLGIVQPGRIGDIIIVLPIAKWFYDRGYKVIWPVCSDYVSMFNHVNYVEPVDIGGTISNSYVRSLEILKNQKLDRLLDLGIGFGRDEASWLKSGLRFNEWKYLESGVPFEERHSLQIIRNFSREKILSDNIKKFYETNGVYSLIHDTGTKGPYKFKERGIRVEPIGGFTIFDWIGLIENANHLYCVDSCIANLADQLDLCVGCRSVWFWRDIPEPSMNRRILLFPKLSEDWKVL